MNELKHKELLGNQYLYYQAFQSPYLYAFDPNNIHSVTVFF